MPDFPSITPLTKKTIQPAEDSLKTIQYEKQLINKIIGSTKEDQVFLFDHLVPMEVDISRLDIGPQIKGDFFDSPDSENTENVGKGSLEGGSKINKSTGFETAGGKKILKPSLHNSNSNNLNQNTYNKISSGNKADLEGYEIPSKIDTPELRNLLKQNPSYLTLLPSIIDPSINNKTEKNNKISGLKNVKQILQEIIVWPLQNPELFINLRKPPKGLLLFGPPGTGKTMLGRFVATEVDAVFFSISASSLLSKYIGDSEKAVRGLFTIANLFRSVIFIDEIDSILSSRSEGEHEASRRVKTEFLVQMEGIAQSNVLVIGATNRPQEIDEAARRRLVKRVYVPLPDLEARVGIISSLIDGVDHCLTAKDVEEVAVLLDGYSGSDTFNLCREAAMEPIRELMNSMRKEGTEQKSPREVRKQDFRLAMNQIRKSVSQKDLKDYEVWNEAYGSL